MKIMTQDKTRVLNFKMTYISYVSKNRICESDFKNSNSCELPCTENDFYGYKRKALHEFDLLVKSVDL